MSEPQHLVVEVVYSWLDDLVERQLSASTRQLAATALRGLLRWAARNDHPVPPTLWDRIEVLDRPQTQPRPLEAEDLQRILAHYAPPKRDLQWMRDRALFLFLLTTGSRITAALSVDRKQLGGRLLVRLKGGREHQLVPSQTSLLWIEQYLSLRGRDEQPALWVHLGRRGRHRLSLTQVNVVWATLARKLRIPAFTSHVLRHTAATELGPLMSSDLELSQHMGWKSPAMVGRYRELQHDREQSLVDQLDQLVPALPAPAPRRRPRPSVIRGKRP